MECLVKVKLESDLIMKKKEGERKEDRM